MTSPRRVPFPGDDAELLAAFEECTLPEQEWGHREHVRVAFLYLRALPFHSAVTTMRERLIALNRAHRVPLVPERGYHETLTVVWMSLVKAALGDVKTENSSRDFLEKHPSLLDPDTSLRFYSKARLFSPEAKERFLEPDLAPLPTAPPANPTTTSPR